MQANLFDEAESKQQNEATQKAMQEEIYLLKARIEKGEKWLEGNKGHPKYKDNERLYWELVRERDQRCVILANRRELKAVVMQLPPGVRYQPNGSGKSFDCLRVLFTGEPVEPYEITREAFNEFVKTMGLIPETVTQLKQ